MNGNCLDPLTFKIFLQKWIKLFWTRLIAGYQSSRRERQCAQWWRSGWRNPRSDAVKCSGPKVRSSPPRWHGATSDYALTSAPVVLAKTKPTVTTGNDVLDESTSPTHHNKSAVEVETLSAAPSHHVPGASMRILQHRHDEEEHVQEGVQTEKEQFAAVVVPVCPRQVSRSLTFLLLQIRRFQPVGGTGRKHKKWKFQQIIT